MIRKLLGDLPLGYFLLRIANIAVRPVTLFALAVFWDNLSVSTVALGYTFGAWLMVPMSLGSYRWVLPIERRYERTSVFRMRAGRAYSLIVALSVLTVVPIVYAVSVSITDDHMAGYLVTQIVIYDFVVHEQSRRILYDGQLVPWAKFLLSTNLALPAAWIAGFAAVYAISSDYAMTHPVAIAAATTFPVLLVVLQAFVAKHVDFRGGQPSAAFSAAVIRRISRYWQYAVIGIMAKSHQHVDKVITAVILPELVWVVALVNYLTSVPVTAYEMINLAKLKSRVLRMNSHEVTQRMQVTGRDVWTFLAFAIPSGLIAIGFLYSQGLRAEAPVLVTLYLIFSWFFVLSLKRAELAFWWVKDKWVPFRIDFWAGALNVLVAIAVMLLGKGLLVVKLSAILGTVLKSTWTKKTLRRILDD